MTKKKLKLDYQGSIPWLIFWAIVFFPVALVLLLTGAKFDHEGKTYHIQYDGSRGWLCFWTVACFPVTFALILLNGITLVIDDNTQRVPIV
ncbi:MAG: hypothetical protein IT289_13550 [Oligoflexia bacterium]|nr:hypothetical protein [Oligoflexia bacterium]